MDTTIARITTLVYVFDSRGRVLLCMKKRSFGEGKWCGPGGKVEKNETINEGASRELGEETGITISPNALTKKGTVMFYWENKPEWNQECHIFEYRGYEGGYQETEEMMPQWFDSGAIPYASMWDSDAVWFPILLSGKEFEYAFIHSDDGKVVSHKRIK